MAAGLGFIEFTTGDVLTAAAANGYLASQVVMVFDDAAARSAAITSPQEGMITYLKDTNAVEKYDGAAFVAVSGGSSPLTTKGDLYTFDTADARIGVGANNTVLTADSAEATGLKWATPASGGWTLISTTSLVSLGSATLSLTSIPGTFTNLHMLVNDAAITSSTGEVTLGLNSAAGGCQGATYGAGTATSNLVYNGKHKLTNSLDLQTATYGNFNSVITVFNYTSADTKFITSATHFERPGSGNTGSLGESDCFTSGAITSLQLVSAGGNWNLGTVRLYGEA